MYFIVLYILKNKNKKLFENFLKKVFLHFYTNLNISSDINIDYIDLTKSIAKNKDINLKESFGKDEADKNYFKIFLDQKLEVFLMGNNIKTLRKKAYKEIIFKLLD